MQKTIRVPVMEAILDENEKLAQGMNRDFSSKGIFVVNVLGAPGAGKTTSIVNIIENLKDKNVGVIEGDIESDIDTLKLEAIGIPAQQINTQGACHLDAPVIAQAADSLKLADNSLVFIENVGNLVCPAAFDLGESLKLAVLSAPEGDEKPLKYPALFKNAQLTVITKSELAAACRFDIACAAANIRSINPNAVVIALSVFEGTGMDAYFNYLLNLL